MGVATGLHDLDHSNRSRGNRPFQDMPTTADTPQLQSWFRGGRVPSARHWDSSKGTGSTHVEVPSFRHPDLLWCGFMLIQVVFVSQASGRILRKPEVGV